MTRRRGERTDKHRDRSHPFQVEIQIPVGGIGPAFDVMYRWATWHDHETTSAGRSMCWCFCRREVADAFAMDFGGRRIDRQVDPHFLKIDLPDAKELERRARVARIGMEKMTAGRPPDTRRPFKEAAKIPFSSFNNPADVARAHGALDRAWKILRSEVPDEDHERERTRLAYIVASIALIAADDEELVARALERFRRRPSDR